MKKSLAATFAVGLVLLATLWLCPSTPPLEARDTTVAAACSIAYDKTAAPAFVASGGAVTVTLTLQASGDCAASPVDVALVLDRSGSMLGDKLTQAKQAATAFVNQMSLASDQVAVISFAGSGLGQVNAPLTHTINITATLNTLVAGGMTDMVEGLQLAAAQLTGPAHLANNAPVIIVLSDGQHNETTPGELLNAATAIKNAGIRLISIGLGADADEGQLRAMASSASDYYFAPAAADLSAIYARISPTVRVAARNLVLTDTLSSAVTLMPNSFGGPVWPTVTGPQLVWNIAAIPADPITLTYQVAVTSTAGVWPTNISANATYLDPAGVGQSLTFPVPSVTVAAACQTPEIRRVQPGWGCAASSNNVQIQGSSFFTLTDFSAITGTFSLNAWIDAQPLAVSQYSGSSIFGSLTAGALLPGTYDATVTNSCALSPTLPLPPTQTFTGTLLHAFTLFPAPSIASVKPDGGYPDTPANITICGAGFTPDAVATVLSDTTPILLEEQSLTENGCIAGRLPAGLPVGPTTLSVQGACGSASAPYEVLDPLLNDDLWALGEDLWISPSLTPNTNQAIQLGLQVNRRGGKDTLPDVTVRFYEGTPFTYTTVIGNGHIYMLSPNVGPSQRIDGTSTSAVNWTPSAGAGPYILWAMIDPANAITETFKSNNVYSRSVQVLPAPPLRDQVAPVVGNFSINNGTTVITATTVYTRGVRLQFGAQDFAQAGALPSGVASINFVEYVFNAAAQKWIPVSASGWLTFTPSVTTARTYTYTLTPEGGLRVIQAWAADAAQKISRFPNWKTVNYAPPCTSIARDGKQVYRQNVNAGDTLRVEVKACSGDPDLYIWPPDWQSGNPPYVSNQSGSATESFSVTVATPGIYQLEVYGFSAARYSLQIEVEPAAGPIVLGRPVAVSGGRSPSKIEPTEPILPLGNRPVITDGVPPVEPPPQGQNINPNVYLPMVMR